MILVFNSMTIIQNLCTQLLLRNPNSPIPVWMLHEKQNGDVAEVAEKDQQIKHKKL